MIQERLGRRKGGARVTRRRQVSGEKLCSGSAALG